MNHKYFLILICFLNFSCSNNIANEPKEIIAIINEEKIYKLDFDSITANQIYDLKLDLVKGEIINKVIQREAENNSSSVYDLIKNITSTEVDSLIKLELKRNNYNQIIKIDSSQAQNIYNTAEYHVKKTILGERLINKNKIEVYLEKEFHPSFSGELYDSYLFTPDMKVEQEIIVISNYECSYCYDFHKKIKHLIEPNNSTFNIKFAYFDDQILKFASAPIAADKQGRFNDMNDFIFDNVQNGTINDSIIFEFAKDLHLDLEKFKNDYFSASTYKKLNTNRNTILSNNIYSTPTLIINKKIYNEPNIFDILKRKINEKK